MSESFDTSHLAPVNLLGIKTKTGLFVGRIILWCAAVPAVCAALVLLLSPVTRSSRPAARHTQCKNNLKQIGLALNNYHEAFGEFPPAYSTDTNGTPLHSWRTLILPYHGDAEFYRKAALDKPWDDPLNSELAKSFLYTYCCPEMTSDRELTTYRAIVGSGTVIQNQASKVQNPSFVPVEVLPVVIEFPRGTEIKWMSPVDATPAEVLDMLAGSDRPHSGGFNVLFADGSVRSLKPEELIPLVGKLLVPQPDLSGTTAGI